MSVEKRHILLRFLRYAWPYRGLLVLILLTGGGVFMLPLVRPYAFRLLVDDVVLNTDGLADSRRVQLLWILTGVLVGTCLLEAAAMFVRGYCRVRVSSGMAFDIRQALWRHLQHLSLGFHQSRPTGSLLSRLMSDIAVSQQMINMGILNVLINMILGAVALTVLFSLSWELTLVVISVLPIYGFLYRKINPRLRQASRDVQEQSAVISGQAVERLAGIAVVQSFAQEREEERQFAEQADELRGRFVRRGKLSQTLNASGTFLIEAAGSMVYIIWALLALRGQMSVGQIIQFAGSAVMLYRPIRQLSQIDITFQTSMAAIERVFAIFDITPEVKQKPDVPDRRPTAGAVRFEDVGFAYEQGQDVLKGLSFEVAPGQRVAIVGESGAGKSTLVTLIPRLYDVTSGAITIDGVDVRDYPIRRLRRSIGIVLQDTILFSGTVRENLRYGRKNACDKEIIEASKAANAHEFICSFPEGYDTLLGERGLTVSGGQRQRLSLARTILQDPRILILDEATSSLDSESENLITEALQRVMTGRTSLIIAHRLSTVTSADRILVMREGRIAESGWHDQLLAAGGYYSYLFGQQFKPLQEMVKQAKRAGLDMSDMDDPQENRG